MLEKPGIRKLVNDLIDELISIANAEGCKFPNDFKSTILETMTQSSDHHSTMYQDYIGRRPMEIEVYLGSPIKIAQLVGAKAPHCETLYAVLHHINQTNQSKSPNSSPPSTAISPPSRPMPPRSQMSIRGRPPPNQGPMGGTGGRRPPVMNGGPPPPNGHPGRFNTGYSSKSQMNGASRRNSFENDLEEFGHIAMYGESLDPEDGNYFPDAGGAGHPGAMGGDPGRNRAPLSGELALRERELALRQRELELREQELMRRNETQMRGGGGHGRGGGRRRSQAFEDDEDEDDEDDVYYDSGPAPPPVDPDTIDMMSVTSKRNRRVPSAGNLRNMDAGMAPTSRGLRSSMANSRPAMRNRTSARLVSEIPTLHDNILENPLMGYSSNRYGAVDRKMLHESSRANSLSAARLGDIRDDPAFSNLRGGGGGGPYPGHGPAPGPRQGVPPPHMRNGTPGPGNYPPDMRGRGPPQGPPPRQAIPRYLPGTGDQPIPGHVDHHSYDPVSQSHLNKRPPSNTNRSTTGSASASATSGDSGSGVSALNDSGHSAYSSSSSLDRKAAYVR